MQVKLTKPELFLAGIVGLWRKIQNIGTRRKSLRADDALDYDVDVRGAQGEIAFCKALGVYPTGLFAFRAADVEIDGEHFEVRTTPYPNGRLPIYERDRDDAIYVLVTGKDGDFRVRGWILGEFGKDPQFWDEKIPRPAFLVPQDRLAPFRRRAWVTADGEEYIG